MIRQLYAKVIIPTITYDSLIWWHKVKNKAPIRILGKLQIRACLGITGALITTRPARPTSPSCGGGSSRRTQRHINSKTAQERHLVHIWIYKHLASDGQAKLHSEIPSVQLYLKGMKRYEGRIYSNETTAYVIPMDSRRAPELEQDFLK